MNQPPTPPRSMLVRLDPSTVERPAIPRKEALARPLQQSYTLVCNKSAMHLNPSNYPNNQRGNDQCTLLRSTVT